MVKSQNATQGQFLSGVPLSPQDVPIVMKTKYPVHIIVFGMITIDGDFISSFIFPQSLRLKREVEASFLKEIDREGCYWKTVCLATGFFAMSHKQENPVSDTRKFLWPHQSKHLHAKCPRFLSPWLLCEGYGSARDQQKPVQYRR